MKVLLVEDERELSDAIAAYLRDNGHICEEVSEFYAALDKISTYEYDCMLLDLTIPGGHGLELMAHARNIGSTAGIIIITARGSVEDKVNGLNTGADDYLAKPFHLSELHARMQSLVRRKQQGGIPEIRIENLTLYPENYELQIDNSPVDLTRKEFDLLLYFVHNKGRVVTRDAIAEHLWGDNYDVLENFDFLYSHIKNLKKKMAEGGSRDMIKNVYGVGYKFLGI